MMASKSAHTVYTAEGCSFSYATTPILSEIRLQLDHGKLYGLIGPNGSGKTTLIRLLTGTSFPTEGSIHLYNKALQDYTKAELSRLLSYVPQIFSLGFDFTVEEVVMMGRHPYISRFGSPSTEDHRLVDEALKALDIFSLKKRYVTRLSGGECQRVLVARALAQNCDVMVLDEATANLDIRHSIGIMRALKQRVTDQDSTIITAIHDLDLAAAFCDELIILNRGQLFAKGPVNDLVTEDMLTDIFGVDCKISYSTLDGPHIRYRYSHV